MNSAVACLHMSTSQLLHHVNIAYMIHVHFVVLNLLPFLCFQGTYEKGTKDEIEEFSYQLLDVTGDGIFGR